MREDIFDLQFETCRETLLNIESHQQNVLIELQQQQECIDAMGAKNAEINEHVLKTNAILRDINTSFLQRNWWLFRELILQYLQMISQYSQLIFNIPITVTQRLRLQRDSPYPQGSDEPFQGRNQDSFQTTCKEEVSSQSYVADMDDSIKKNNNECWQVYEEDSFIQRGSVMLDSFDCTVEQNSNSNQLYKQAYIDSDLSRTSNQNKEILDLGIEQISLQIAECDISDYIKTHARQLVILSRSTIQLEQLCEKVQELKYISENIGTTLNHSIIKINGQIDETDRSHTYINKYQ